TPGSRFLATRTTSSRNSWGYGFGAVHILPAAPLGTTDQMSPIRAAVPIFTVKHQEPVAISRALNAQIRPAYSVMASSVPGQTTLADEMRVKTSARRARPWREHLDIHQGVRDLLVVAGWRDFGTWNVSVSRQDDPERALAGNALGERWARVSTYAMPKPTGNEQSNRFLFRFDDIGARGVSRWLGLRHRHRRAIAGMIHSVGTPAVALETAISEAGAALEQVESPIVV
ncbi:ApeA N-terminal domain 1-containing protein, partial [Nocardioides flavus (ex Wang et al. 2016)]